MATRGRKVEPATSSAPGDDDVWVILPTKSPKKHSVKFETDEDGVAVSNVYLSGAAYKALGSPNKLKITVEAADE